MIRIATFSLLALSLAVACGSAPAPSEAPAGHEATTKASGHGEHGDKAHGDKHEGDKAHAAGHGEGHHAEGAHAAAHGDKAAAEGACDGTCGGLCGDKDGEKAHADGHGAEHGEGGTCAEGEDCGCAEAEVAAPKGWEAYGASVASTGAPMPAAKLVNEPASFVGQTVFVEGEIADVCQKAGCWTVLSDGTKSIRVTMKDHFSIAMDSTGATGRFEGEVVAKPIDPETVAHFKSESAKPEIMPEVNLPDGATETYVLVASAVQLKR